MAALPVRILSRRLVFDRSRSLDSVANKSGQDEHKDNEKARILDKHGMVLIVMHRLTVLDTQKDKGSDQDTPKDNMFHFEL